MRSKRLIFLGPPGTGKGTQARRLSDQHGWYALSSGDVLRAEIDAESEVGKAAAKYVREGALVPDDVVTDVILNGLKRIDRSRGFILDGFPRTVPQAESLEKCLRDWGFKIDAAIDFQLADEVIIERIVSRRVCKNCSATYNVRFNPSRQEGRCDRCGGQVVQRDDDREDVVQHRLETYRAQTAPLIDYYGKQRIFHRVDAKVGIQEVAERVARILKEIDQDK